MHFEGICGLNQEHNYPVKMQGSVGPWGKSTAV